MSLQIRNELIEVLLLLCAVFKTAALEIWVVSLQVNITVSKCSPANDKFAIGTLMQQ